MHLCQRIDACTISSIALAVVIVAVLASQGASLSPAMPEREATKGAFHHAIN